MISNMLCFHPIDDGHILKVQVAEVFHFENGSKFTFVQREGIHTIWGSGKDAASN